MQDIRAIERQTAAELKRRMQVLNGEIPDDGEYEPGINEDLGKEALSNNNVVASDMNGGNCIAITDNASSDAEGTSDKTGLPSRSTDHERHQEMRATFNSIEYSEAEIPNIIPKPSERMHRKSSGGLGIGSSGVMKRSRSGGLNVEKSSLDKCEGTLKCICYHSGDCLNI